MMKIVSLMALASVAAGSAVEITDSNYEDIMFNSGKNSFVKFLAPW